MLKSKTASIGKSFWIHLSYTFLIYLYIYRYNKLKGSCNRPQEGYVPIGPRVGMAAIANKILFL